MNLAAYIDNTILIPNCTKEEINRVCEEALKYQFAAVCIPPYYIKLAARLLEESNIHVATVIGFPMGYAAIPAKVEEIKRAIDDGADELDVVINIAALKNGDWAHVKNDIDSVTLAVHLKGKIIKIILEAGLLSEEELLRVCKICEEMEVDYVKTSTGYQGGATVDQVKFLRANLPPKIKIKASGGIRTTEQAERLIASGADRIGTSSGVSIVK